MLLEEEEQQWIEKEFGHSNYFLSGSGQLELPLAPLVKKKKLTTKPSAYLYLPDHTSICLKSTAAVFPLKNQSRLQKLISSAVCIGSSDLFDNQEACHSCQLRKQKGKGVSH